jgi:FKBP-type peptidyl-prolyl cis-trans isomerase
MSKNVRTKDLILGIGVAAEPGDEVEVSLEGFLPKGERVLLEKALKFILGKRRVMAGLEYGVRGMRIGGRREIHIPPHLAYGSRGTETVPPNASLRIVIELLSLK